MLRGAGEYKFCNIHSWSEPLWALHSLLANIVCVVVMFQPEDILKGLDEKNKDINTLIKPDGTKKFPAKTCYDLFLDHKTFKSGK